MLCKLFNHAEANKKNTHYLTDSLIRRCLNEDGNNIREKGFMFDFSSSSPFLDFSFQRNTSIENIKKALGREPNDEEIGNAKKKVFSVDNFFCSKCEDLFSRIENDFILNYLPYIRKQKLSEIKFIEIDKNTEFRLFFYLQIFRTSVCADNFRIDSIVIEYLRNLILDYNNLKNKKNHTIPFRNCNFRSIRR
jgi:hypothetical protein